MHKFIPFFCLFSAFIFDKCCIILSLSDFFLKGGQYEHGSYFRSGCNHCLLRMGYLFGDT